MTKPTSTIVLPEICPVPESSPGQDLPSASELFESARSCLSVPPPQGLLPFLEPMGVPVSDLLMNPFSAQISAMACAQGRVFYHHERRGYIPMTSEQLPEIPVGELDQGMPVWSEGVRRSPKYFSFGLDTVFPPYHPNHRRQWRAHELLHTLCSFFWRPRITRFESYLSARLSELVPVVHWYNLDEIFRPRCARHLGRLVLREHCEVCESGYPNYWDIEPDDRLVEAARVHAHGALEHFRTEIEACLLELESGKIHPRPRPGLDSSSDALGYMKGHWNRITAWSFGAYVEHFLIPGRDYFTTVEEHLHHVDSVFRAVIRGGVTLESSAVSASRLRRRLQDLGKRAFLCLEWSQDQDLESAVMPVIESCADLCRELINEEVSEELVVQHEEELLACFAVFEDRFPPAVIQALPEKGLPWSSNGARHLVDGLLSGLPDSLSMDKSWVSTVDDFSQSSEFMERGELIGRYSKWLKRTSSPSAEFALVESWLLSRPQRDPEGEDFGVIPDDVGRDSGDLRLNKTFRRASFSAETLSEFFGWELSEGSVEIACAWVNGQPTVLPWTPEHAKIIDMLSGPEMPSGESFEELLDIGFLFWLPKPQ